MLVLGIDNFKAVNDTLGHAIGDKLLRGVAKRLRSTLREEDTLARLNSDEFAIIQTPPRNFATVDDAGPIMRESAVTLAKRIIACLDVRNGQVVKGINFEELRNAGDPAELARRYNREGIDELVVLDVTATIEGTMNILGILGADPETRNGFNDVQVHFKVDAESITLRTLELLARRGEIAADLPKQAFDKYSLGDVRAADPGQGMGDA